jgi:hypothetical protein
MRLALDDTHERRELALRQSVVLGLAGRVDQVFQAVGPAVNLAAGDLYRPQVLHDAHYGVAAVARHRVLLADVLPLLVVLPPVAKYGHSEIVHSFDLDHIEGREREEAEILVGYNPLRTKMPGPGRTMSEISTLQRNVASCVEEVGIEAPVLAVERSGR